SCSVSPFRAPPPGRWDGAPTVWLAALPCPPPPRPQRVAPRSVANAAANFSRTTAATGWSRICERGNGDFRVDRRPGEGRGPIATGRGTVHAARPHECFGFLLRLHSRE